MFKKYSIIIAELIIRFSMEHYQQAVISSRFPYYEEVYSEVKDNRTIVYRNDYKLFYRNDEGVITEEYMSDDDIKRIEPIVKQVDEELRSIEIQQEAFDLEIKAGETW